MVARKNEIKKKKDRMILFLGSSRATFSIDTTAEATAERPHLRGTASCDSFLGRILIRAAMAAVLRSRPMNQTKAPALSVSNGGGGGGTRVILNKKESTQRGNKQTCQLSAMQQKTRSRDVENANSGVMFSLFKRDNQTPLLDTKKKWLKQIIKMSHRCWKVIFFQFGGVDDGADDSVRANTLEEGDTHNWFRRQNNHDNKRGGSTSSEKEMEKSITYCQLC